MHLTISGLDEHTTENELMTLFSGIGSVESIKIIRDINTGKSKGFAIIEMPVDAEGQEAINKFHGSIWDERKLAVFKMPRVLPGEMEFRIWLNDNAHFLLRKIGVSYEQKVMDFGCGPGIFSLASADIVGLNGKVYAMDTRSNALERLKETASKKGLANIEPMLLDKAAVSIFLPDKSVDVILLYDVLQEITDKPALIKELHRILRPDGFLSIFPMHMGTEKCMALIANLAVFELRDSYCPPGLQSMSDILNFIRSNSTANR
jgi:2-polyprenyl-3-methyl-5-hydroxy-6-metoxy-1,4-benzoquinol methylase